MKQVTIINKVIPAESRSKYGTSGRSSVISGGASVDLSPYLLKAIWERNFEERKDEAGNEYIYIKKPIVGAAGMTLFAGDEIKVDSIFKGLPIDTETLQWMDGVLTVVGGGTGGGASNWDELEGKPSWITDTKPKYAWYEIQDKPSWITTDKPKYSYTEITGLTDELAKYVTLATDQSITGMKDFSNGMKVSGILFKVVDGILTLDCSIAVTGGITTFAVGDRSASTIMDALVLDENTLQIGSDGKLTVVGGTGGGASNWDELKGKPSWITDTKPTYAWGEITQKPATLSGYGIQASDVLNVLKTVDGSGSGLDADTLDGKHLSSTESLFNGIAYIAGDGVMEIGRYLDFHYDSTDTSNYSTRLSISSKGHSNNVYLPIQTGTLALTTDNVASATKLQTARTIWGQSFDGTKNITGTFLYSDEATLRIYSDYNPTFPSAYGKETACIQSCFDSQDPESSDYVTKYPNRSVLSLQPRGGYVGIGTTSPSYKLEVNGSTSTTNLYINGIQLHKTADGVITLEGNLAVTGGITQFAVNEVSSSTIMDGVVVDGTSIKKEDGVLKVMNAGGGEAGSVKWANIDGKPTTLAGYSITASDVLSTLKTVDGSGSGLDADTLDGVHLADIQKKVGYGWTTIYKVNNWSRIIKINGYSNVLLSINFDQSSQASNHLYLISTGYNKANIIQLGANNFNINYGIKIRVTESSASVHYVEIYSSYGYNGATDISVKCNYLKLDYNSTVTVYTAYTAGGDTVRKEITSSFNKIVSDLQGNADTATIADKLSVNAGSATNPIYFVNGIPVAGTYTFGNASGNAAINNGVVCTNLNADMLDGYHLKYDWSSNNKTCVKLITIKILSAYVNTPIEFRINGRSGGDALISVKFDNYNGTDPGLISFTGYGIYSGYIDRLKIYKSATSTWEIWLTSQTQYHDSGKIYAVYVPSGFLFTVDSSASDTLPSYSTSYTCSKASIYGNIAGNSSTATKLQTARTLWGQSFDGTNNVSGNIIDTLEIKSKIGVWLNLHGDIGVAFYTEGTAKGVFGTNGNFGVGTINPSHKIHVLGDIYATTEIKAEKDICSYRRIECKCEENFELYPSILLHIPNVYYGQIFYKSDAFHFTTGANQNASTSDYRSLYTGNITISKGSDSTLTIWDSSAYLKQVNISETDISGYGLYLYGSAGTRIANKLLVDSNAIIKGNIIIKGSESSDITSNIRDNGAIENLKSLSNNLSSIRNSLTFNWYNTSWYIGNIRGHERNSLGFGIVSGTNCYLRVNTDATYVYGNLLVTGGGTFYSSDIRAKNVIESLKIKLNDIANAPVIKFKWNGYNDLKDDGKLHIGGIAQYIEKILPECVIGQKDDFLSFDYATTGYVFSVLTARHLLSYETRTDRIIRKLKERIRRLERQLNIENHEEVCIVAD